MKATRRPILTILPSPRTVPVSLLLARWYATLISKVRTRQNVPVGTCLRAGRVRECARLTLERDQAGHVVRSLATCLAQDVPEPRNAVERMFRA